jgi:hypothetical protein
MSGMFFLGFYSKVLLPCHIFPICDIVVAIIQKFKTKSWSLSLKKSKCHFLGSLPHMLLQVKFTWSLYVIAFDKRYLVPPIVLHIKCWEWPLDLMLVQWGACSCRGKLSLDFCATSCAYATLKFSTMFNLHWMSLAFWANFGRKHRTFSLSKNL